MTTRRVAVCLVYPVMLFVFLWLAAACGGENRPDSGEAAMEQGFTASASNQVEVHQEHSTDGHEPHVHAAPDFESATLQVAFISSELVVGANRFAVGLLDEEGAMIQDAQVHFHYFDLSKQDAPQLEAEANAYPVHTPDGRTTIYAHERIFERAGDWGVEIHIRKADGATAIKRIGFQVLAESPTLKVGQEAPRLPTPTLASADNDLQHLTSAPSPNPALYTLSLEQAMSNGKPTVLLFATPAFCQTRFCGPAYEIISGLQPRYADAANFIHVEIYTGLPNPASNNWEVAPAMFEFGLSTEPWVYILDPGGKVVYRVEGVFSADEVERQLSAIIPSS